MSYPRAVTICDVGTRDGFQIEHEFIPTATKIAVIDAIIAAGVYRISPHTASGRSRTPLAR